MTALAFPSRLYSLYTLIYILSFPSVVNATLLRTWLEFDLAGLTRNPELVTVDL